MKWMMLPFLFASALLLAACGSKKEEVDQGELAARAARLYYEQLLLNLQQFVEQQKSRHEGIDSISLGASVFSAKDSTASAFLLFHFGDRTTEQVVVPMIKKKGVWRMR